MEKETRIKTSVVLPKKLLVSVDKIKSKKQSRSKLIENLLNDFVTKEKRRELNKRDMKIINRNADKINEQALETLEYQVDW